MGGGHLGDNAEDFSENDIFREEIRSLEMVRLKMQESLDRTEEELKVVKQKLAEKEAEADEEDVPMAQRKRFTRSEMQRVLIDRNTYKVGRADLLYKIRIRRN